MLFKSNGQGVDYIIVGLGNPGKKYDGTRHNIGFAAIDYIAAELNTKITKSKFDALYTIENISGKKVMLLKPQTFMNLSGVSVQKASSFYNVPAENIVVLFDDISGEPGNMRIRRSGSAGGHNGLKSIIADIGEGFPRIKIGVGAKPNPNYDLADWVLSRFSANETKLITARFDDIKSACDFIINGEIDRAMNKYSK